jgi:hypothetical protein
MIIRGRNVGRVGKELTEEQLALADQAKEQGWFDTVYNQGKDLSLSSDENVGGLLGDLRAIFPKNYVGKERKGKQWVYTIYAGDKEMMKEIYSPIRFKDPEKDFMDYLRELGKLKQ